MYDYTQKKINGYISTPKMIPFYKKIIFWQKIIDKNKYFDLNYQNRQKVAAISIQTQIERV